MSLLNLCIAHGADGNERDRFRPAFFSTSANFDFGQFRLRPISTSANTISANFWMLNFWTTQGGAPQGWSPEGWGAQNFALFFPSSRRSVLLHCAFAKANYLLHVVQPNAVAEFAHLHDQRIWNCLCQLTIASHPHHKMRRSSSLHLFHAARTSVSAYWASWDTFPMIRASHGAVAIVREWRVSRPWFHASFMASFVHRRPPRNWPPREWSNSSVIKSSSNACRHQPEL